MSTGYRYSCPRLAVVTLAACGATGCGGRTTSEAPSEKDQSVLPTLTTNDDSKVSGGAQLPHGLPFPDAAGATLVTWQIPANESTAGAFDFCIDDIRALR